MSSSVAAAPPRPGDLMAVACVNPLCREPRSDAPARRRGWRFRSGEPALLCDRCFSAYEQGKFCEIFHLDDSGWCCCETCGKKLHSGCIVSSSAYIFLDAGGIECVPCARKSLAMAPSQIWPTAAHQLAQASERPNDLLVRSLNTMPTYSRQVQRLWKLASTQSDLNRRLAYELDRPSGPDKLVPGIRTSIFRQEKKAEDLSERIAASSLNTIMRNRSANGSTNVDSVSKQNTFSREGGGDGMRGSSQRVGENDPASIRKGESSIQGSTSSSGVNFDAYANPSANVSLPSSVVKDDQSSPLICLAAPFPVARDVNDPSRVSVNQPHGQTTSMARKLCTDPPNVVDSDIQAHMRNGKPKIDSRALNHLLPRYRPRITDQELQHMFGDSNSVITPLFEKILSASDAGRIGRLVLPKKCAEAYFPTISQPEGVPLKVQDVKGNEWVFQFRFWPNNNSRMYVLEGVTPCIQSMQLQAGDIVTFSRTNPDGKLVMGFRKASSVSPEQENQVMNAESNVSPHLEENSRSNTPIMASLAPQPIKGRADSWSPIKSEDQSLCPKIDHSGHIQKDGPNKKPSPAPTKRKGNTLGPKSKRLRIENKDSIELKLTWQEAQELFRPPPNHPSSIVVIEGHEVEEYEEAPVLGMPTIFTTNQAGETNQWAQCEDCSKWRRLPEDALITFKWTCSDNKWDPKRSSCAAPQELSKAQLADFLPVNTGSSKKSKAKVETEPVEVSDGLDTLANLAILGEGESLRASSQCTTRHPRHRPGCTCIVCIQPPSGKGPKHKPTCTCNVCLTVRRRFQTLMMRRELRQSEKEADSARKQHQLIQSPSRNLPQSGIEPTLSGSNNVAVSIKEPLVNYDGMADDESERRTPSSPSVSPLKNHIDLNIQPEREEEPPHTGNDAAIIKRDSLPKVKAEEETLD